MTHDRIDKPNQKNEDHEITLLPKGYQPSKAEKEEEFDMPGADMKTLRQAFLNIKIRRGDKAE